MCGHSLESANLRVQWHVIAMYAPSFFTGKLIVRFGAGRITELGLILAAVSIAVGLAGMDIMHFWWSLILLGAGWNTVLWASLAPLALSIVVLYAGAAKRICGFV